MALGSEAIALRRMVGTVKNEGMRRKQEAALMWKQKRTPGSASQRLPISSTVAGRADARDLDIKTRSLIKSVGSRNTEGTFKSDAALHGNSSKPPSMRPQWLPTAST